jgi:hypothetical protein
MSLFEIQKVTVDPVHLTAQVRLADGAPARTSDDIEATGRIYDLMPAIVGHACVSPQGDTFGDALADTELAHLLEHVTVELMAQLDMEDVSAGNTVAADEDRTWKITLSCPNDVLTLGALSSAVWFMDWAFLGGGEGAAPSVEHVVAGLRELAKDLPDPA